MEYTRLQRISEAIPHAEFRNCVSDENRFVDQLQLAYFAE
jgi:hypothetical protein